ncbi:ABC transporter permease [Anaerobium acetethylicum]|uniref:Autoinducer 2 import system permease protein LsrD n=1 Tax=Anaerobium acetethylicum TaxID=1619234 RepID=A0A1D3TRY6_9FIRM|nr:ABC transporter permease [Anaerobium acetethylicum]SCP96493.1 rhamnose transport system permease protein [Anaerobium acetethylicum]
MAKTKRIIVAEQAFSWKKFFVQWEWFLLLIFIAINVMNSFTSEYYLSTSGLLTATSSFLEKAFVALPMAYILVMGDIDISVGSTVALSSVLMAVSYNNLGLPMGLALIVCLLVGALCGFINGIILTKFPELAPMIVTLGTSILYRGIAVMILEDQASGSFPMWFSNIYWGKIGGVVPYMLVFFIICAVAFGVVLHKTTFGRRLFAIGSNSLASKYAGIPVQKIRLIVFTLTGLFAAVTAVFLTARMGSTRPNIGEGYELEAISMIVLGGISTDGGKGRFIGAIISIFTIGFLRYGLGLINFPSQAMMIVIGGLLIIAVMAPNLNFKKIFGKKAAKAA